MKVVILRGIPGSGKSTLAKKLVADALKADSCFAKICSADNFFVDADGVYRFDARKLGEAHGACLRKFTNHLEWCCLDDKKDLIVVDNTNTTAMEMAPYAALALAFGAELEVITVNCDPSIAAARNTHGVPADKVRAMFDRLNGATLPKQWAHSIYSPPDDRSNK